MSDPYRDENESLRAEVARLRVELAARRGGQGKLALVLVAIDFLAIVALRPWLNGTSDLKLWVGLSIVVGVAVAAVVSARGFRKRS